MSELKARKSILRRPLGITLLITGVVILALIATLGARLYALSGEGSFSAPLNDPVLVATSSEAVGDTLDFFVSVRSSSDATIILQSLTFDKGIPMHVTLLNTAVLLLDAGGCCAYFVDTEWPPLVRQGNTFTLHPIQGFALTPYASLTLVYAVRADAPGTYTLGPVTLHGVMPAFSGSGVIGLPVTQTYHEYSILCYSGQADCTQAQQSI